MTKQTDREIYENPDWSKRRRVAAVRRRWYDAVPLQETMARRDRESGHKERKFPLGLNLVELACDIHRDFARGMVPDSENLVARATVDRSDDAERGTLIEEVINDQVWEPSHGAAIQQEALLEMNIYGGCVFQLCWEPWDFDLPLRLSVRLVKDPSCIHPVWSKRNPYRMEKVYIGHPISHEAARSIYGIEPHSEAELPLYMEHWTRSEWRVTVDDQVPTMHWGDQEWPMEGTNPWGFVPVYYIPHERATDLFGKGLIDDEDLVLEVNARAADTSDIVRSAWPGMLWGRDIEHNPTVNQVMNNAGDYLFDMFHLGRTRAVAGANPPEVGAIPVVEMPESLVLWNKELITYWQLTRRMSPAIFGMDDTQSGRITGPAVEARMVSSTNHAITERINFKDGLVLIARDIVRILSERERSEALSELGITGPGLVIEDAMRRIRYRMSPMLPQDQDQADESALSRLKEGGMSIQDFLAYHDVEDIEGERQRIEEWLTKLAEIEGIVFQMQQEARQQDVASSQNPSQ
ncbi:MAG: hypothetical protein ACYSYL_00265 [Planctomycetota bacterium]|jgi:hypothetical protein